nr:S-layer homology domain-containing protein [Clostridia bacterium]
MQDDTAGICCFPVSGEFKIGDVVRIKGYTDFYQAEMELQVQTIETIGEADPIEPAEAAAAQINDLSLLGSLVSISGTVVSFEKGNDLIQTILVKDEAGDVCRVFIDGYITTAQDVQNVENGAGITAVGLSSYDDTWKDEAYFPRIRVRDRADVVCEPVPEKETTHSSGSQNKTTNSFIDVKEGDYFFDAVEWAAAKGIIDSIENIDENLFVPDYIESRAEFVTFLWKAAGKPAAEGEMPFTDVAEDAPYYDAVLWAYTEGITAGTSETEFSPYRAVSRAMAVTLL